MLMCDTDRRAGETVTTLPDAPGAGLIFIGRVRTPWTDRRDCPKRGDLDGPECRLQLDAGWLDALEGIDEHTHLQVLYWMHMARRDLTRQRPRSGNRLVGTFALRSPMRPNPIASSIVRLVGRSGCELVVRGLDCVDGTPLIDIKPERCPAWDAEWPGKRGETG
jgi:tRNA-Thr(GGU) m(6)t(6)A37 methyltransferase TsaA